VAVSFFDDPVLASFAGAEDMASLFGFTADCSAMLRFEAALARAEADEGLIPDEAAEAIGSACAGFAPDTAAIGQAMARDGVPVAELVQQLRAAVAEPHGAMVHFGATSQDAIDTSLVLRLREAVSLFETGLTEVVGLLLSLDEKFGDRSLMGVTRMQEAVAISVRDRLRTWRAPLLRHLSRIEELKPRLLVLQFGGAAGTLDKLGDKGPAVAQRLAEALGLHCGEGQWHSQRDGIAEFASWLSLVSGSLGKMGQDFTLMAQNAVGEVGFSDGGGSSAMPHKHNPVGAELLVALARFNATQLSAMHHALVHENERSGAAWTLEWMVLPQMAVAGYGSVRRSLSILSSIRTLGHV